MQQPIDPRLHHVCLNVTTGSLEVVLELFELLKCPVVYWPNNGYQWAMVGQPQLDFALQITETSDAPLEDLDRKRQTHVAFLSSSPQDVVDEVRKWASSKGITFQDGGWSDKELYFDLPKLFVNFVVEVMHTSIEEE